MGSGAGHQLAAVSEGTISGGGWSTVSPQHAVALQLLAARQLGGNA